MRPIATPVQQRSREQSMNKLRCWLR